MARPCGVAGARGMAMPLGVPVKNVVLASRACIGVMLMPMGVRAGIASAAASCASRRSMRRSFISRSRSSWSCCECMWSSSMAFTMPVRREMMLALSGLCVPEPPSSAAASMVASAVSKAALAMAACTVSDVCSICFSIIERMSFIMDAISTLACAAAAFKACAVAPGLLLPPPGAPAPAPCSASIWISRRSCVSAATRFSVSSCCSISTSFFCSSRLRSSMGSATRPSRRFVANSFTRMSCSGLSPRNLMPFSDMVAALSRSALSSRCCSASRCSICLSCSAFLAWRLLRSEAMASRISISGYQNSSSRPASCLRRRHVSMRMSRSSRSSEYFSFRDSYSSCARRRRFLSCFWSLMASSMPFSEARSMTCACASSRSTSTRALAFSVSSRRSISSLSRAWSSSSLRIVLRLSTRSCATME
mmetsp:Transcript_18166/g.55538  ORF Transcript_18166/g.55538 Transcript_18166/m.55538 type:complete len:421 (+) Transcript_18166:856-2118(+)